MEPRAGVSLIALTWRCFLEARPIVQIIYLLRVLSAWALSVTWPATGRLLPLVTGLAAWFCIVMSVYVLNGVTDVREDRINVSRRPIAQGRLSVGVATRAVWVLAAVGVVAGFATAPWLGLLALLSLAVGWLYSAPPYRLKRRSPGVAVAAWTGMALTYYAGAVIADAQVSRIWNPPTVGVELVVFGTALSLWAALVGGTTKDLPDVTGDQVAGTRNWLTSWGERRFRYVVSAIALLIGVGFIVAAAFLAPRLLPTAIVLTVGAALVAVLLLTRLGAGAHAARRRPYQGFMATQYVTHLVLVTGVILQVF